MEELLNLNSDSNMQEMESNGEVDTASPEGTSNNEPRNTDEMQSSGGVDYPSCGTGTNKQNSATNTHGVRNDGETGSDVQVNMAFPERARNDEQKNAELYDVESGGNIDSPSCEVETERQSSDRDMHDVRSDGEVQGEVQSEVRSDLGADIAFSEGIANDELAKPELGGMASSSGIDIRSCEVETGKPSNDVSMQEVRSDGEVDTTSPKGTTNDEPRSDELDNMESSDIVDYPSSETETNKQNSDTSMAEVESAGEMGSDVEVDMAISEGTTNDEQRNPELGDMESGGSVDAASLKADTERQNRDSDMHEVGSQLNTDMAIPRRTSNDEQRNSEFNDAKPVGDVDPALRSATKKNDPTDVHIDVAESLHSWQMGSPSEPESPLKQKETFMKFAGMSPEDNLRRMELEQSCVERLEMKHAELLIDMIDSLSNHKADMYYLLAFKMVLLIFPYTAWEHVRDRLPAMMSYVTENVKTGLEKRVADAVYTEYPSDKGVDERIICWNQRLELYK
ncbi:hypothetical protein IL306_004467, partial [Fusarium sp. DS 682]